MPVKILRGASDDILEQVIAVLRNYEATHPDAVIDLYRQNSVSIRVRIVDPAFQGMSKKERNDLVWDYLDTLSEDAQADISMLVLLAPTEVEKSMGNLEFRRSSSFGIMTATRRAQVLSDASFRAFRIDFFRDRPNPRPGATR